MALQSTLLSRPSLLTKRKSLVFATLEKESGVVSAYDELASEEEEEEDEEYGWEGTLDELRRRPRKLSDETYYTDSQHDPEWTYTPHGPVTSPSSGQYTNTETMCSDSETSSTHSARDSLPRSHKPQLLTKNGPGDASEAVDINFNPQVGGSTAPPDSSEAEERHTGVMRRSRRRRKSKPSPRDHGHDCTAPPKSPASLSSSYSASYQECDQSLAVNSTPHSFPPQSPTEDLEKELESKLCELASKESDKDAFSEEEEEEGGVQADTSRTPAQSEDPPSAVLDPVSVEDVQKKYSAVSLCSITTEVLKVLNATEELIEEAVGDGDSGSELLGRVTIPEGTDTEKLDEHLTKLEENVYLAAGTVYGLEGQLGDLEECARSISSVTTETELAHLEDQVASAAAQVHQAELQISDIELRISALQTAGLNVAPCTRFSKYKDNKQTPQPQTIDSSRQQRRKLPAPPVQDRESRPELQVKAPRPQ
ncbi:MYRIP protein, partial [Amia calva]|nr:MYRIP protein [Amia calva]